MSLEKEKLVSKIKAYERAIYLLQTDMEKIGYHNYSDRNEMLSLISTLMKGYMKCEDKLKELL